MALPIVVQIYERFFFGVPEDDTRWHLTGSHVIAAGVPCCENFKATESILFKRYNSPSNRPIIHLFQQVVNMATKGKLLTLLVVLVLTWGRVSGCCLLVKRNIRRFLCFQSSEWHEIMLCDGCHATLSFHSFSCENHNLSSAVPADCCPPISTTLSPVLL